MNDNINQTGQNWYGRCPRNMQEAFGVDAKLHKEKRRIDWLNMFLDGSMLVFTVIVLALIYKIGAVVGF